MHPFGFLPWVGNRDWSYPAMQLECGHCGRVVEFSRERPSFCAYCGQPIQETQTASNQPSTTPNGSACAEPPECVGGYRLVRPIGSGGMGTVYEAEERGSGRRVALKLLAADAASSPQALERFRQEGRLASLIAHPRCVFVFGAEEQAG